MFVKSKKFYKFKTKFEQHNIYGWHGKQSYLIFIFYINKGYPKVRLRYIEKHKYLLSMGNLVCILYLQKA